MPKIDLSIVLPVHNEEKNLPFLYEELTKELKNLPLNYEIIFVDDGSKDTSFKILESLSKKDKKVKIVKHLSNYGQSAALGSGTEYAIGENIVTMDSDLQHDPKDIANLIEPLFNGFHVVCGWRKKRGAANKSIPSKIANHLVNRMTGLKLHDSVGGMKAFKKQVSEIVPLYGDMHRYMPILAKWKGFKVTERTIKVRKRIRGKTHYKLRRIFGGFFDLITVKFFVSYSTRPFHIFATTGFICFAIGFIMGIYYLVQKIFFGIHLMQEVASLVLAVMLILLGTIFICFGLIAEMISFEAISNKKRKMYLVEKIIEKKT
jgi:glycosyltransferase involved in cell wall biosynthesis